MLVQVKNMFLIFLWSTPATFSNWIIFSYAALKVSMYVVVRARVLQLGAELAMLQDFMDNHLFQESQQLILKASFADTDIYAG